MPSLRISAALMAAWLTACSSGPEPASQPSPAGDERSVIAVGDMLSRSQIDRINPTNMEQLFEGRFTGVQVIRRGGEPTLRIRGAGEPLLVVDHVPVSSIRFLWGMNPLDIEQIEILKDASTSLYGVRGGNGVVVITTRRR